MGRGEGACLVGRSHRCQAVERQPIESMFDFKRVHRLATVATSTPRNVQLARGLGGARAARCFGPRVELFVF